MGEVRCRRGISPVREYGCRSLGRELGRSEGHETNLVEESGTVMVEEEGTVTVGALWRLAGPDLTFGGDEQRSTTLDESHFIQFP